MEMSEKDVITALASREECRELLARFAEIARPSRGAPRLLFLFARMATIACGWVEGDLRIELKLDGDTTRIDMMSELGPGLRERLLSPVTIHAPLSEFLLAIERFPRAISPLMLKKKTSRRIVLVANEETRTTTMPPPMIEISEESLARVPRAAAPPQLDLSDSEGPLATPSASDDDDADLDSGWDAASAARSTSSPSRAAPERVTGLEEQQPSAALPAPSGVGVKVHEFSPGSRIANKYLVEGEIGEGGLGVVVKAQHMQLEQPVDARYAAQPPNRHRSEGHGRMHRSE